MMRLMWTEFLLQVRSWPFWIGAALVTGQSLYRFQGATPDGIFSPRVWLSSRDDVILWGALILVVLVPTALGRHWRVRDLIWSSPVTTTRLLTGHLLGVVLMAAALVALELAAWGIGYAVLVSASPTQPLGVDWPMIGLGVGRVGLALASLVCVLFLVTVLTHPHARAAYGAGAATVIIGMASVNLSVPLSFLPRSSLRVSDLVGEGPQADLLMWHYFLLGGIALTAAGLGLLLFPARERRGLMTTTERVAVGWVAIMGLAVTGWTGIQWSSENQQVLASVDQLPAGLDLTPRGGSGQVETWVSVNARSGEVSGKVAFLSDQPVEETFLVQVPAGLALTSIGDCQGNQRTVTWITPEVISASLDTALCLDFAGTWRARYDGYTSVPSGPDAFRANVSKWSGSGYAFVSPGANWYPLPLNLPDWTFQVHLRLEGARPISVWPEPAADRALGDFTWTSARGRPRIGFIAGDYQSVIVADEAQALVTPIHAPVITGVVAEHERHVQALKAVIGQKPAPVTYVEMPLLRWPLLVGNTVWLPERYVAEPLGDTLARSELEGDRKFYGDYVAEQLRAYRYARGWLQGELAFSDPVFVGDVLPQPILSLDPLEGQVWLREAMAHYLGLRVADALTGANQLDQILANRLAVARQLQDGPQPSAPGPIVDGTSVIGPPHELAVAFNTIFVSLGDLEAQVGREQTGYAIGEWVSQNTGQTVGLEDWLAFTGVRFGTPVRDRLTALVHELDQGRDP